MEVVVVQINITLILFLQGFHLTTHKVFSSCEYSRRQIPNVLLDVLGAPEVTENIPLKPLAEQDVIRFDILVSDVEPMESEETVAQIILELKDLHSHLHCYILPYEIGQHSHRPRGRMEYWSPRQALF